MLSPEPWPAGDRPLQGSVSEQTVPEEGVNTGLDLGGSATRKPDCHLLDAISRGASAGETRLGLFHEQGCTKLTRDGALT